MGQDGGQRPRRLRRWKAAPTRLLHRRTARGAGLEARHTPEPIPCADGRRLHAEHDQSPQLTLHCSDLGIIYPGAIWDAKLVYIIART